MLLEHVDRFLEYLSSVRQASSHTVRNYRIDLLSFSNFLKEGLCFSDIDRKVLRAFMVDQTEKGLSKKTILRRLSALKSFFSYCLRNELVEKNPLDELERPKIERRLPVSLTYEHIEKLFSIPDTTSYLGLRDRTMMELFYSSGLRLNELHLLKKQDLDEQELLIRVQGKGKKERIVPITQNVLTWIQKLLSHSERPHENSSIFLNKYGNPITPRSIDRIMSFYVKKSGLQGHITPHTIRHTIATHWLEHGMDLKTIQLLLGHSSLATTTIYTHVSSKLKRQTVTSLHPRG